MIENRHRGDMKLTLPAKQGCGTYKEVGRVGRVRRLVPTRAVGVANSEKVMGRRTKTCIECYSA